LYAWLKNDDLLSYELSVEDKLEDDERIYYNLFHGGGQGPNNGAVHTAYVMTENTIIERTILLSEVFLKRKRRDYRLKKLKKYGAYTGLTSSNNKPSQYQSEIQKLERKIETTKKDLERQYHGNDDSDEEKEEDEEEEEEEEEEREQNFNQSSSEITYAPKRPQLPSAPILCNEPVLPSIPQSERDKTIKNKHFLECAICLENVTKADNYTTKCGHIFHETCISKLKQQKFKYCPSCREKI
jgi:hypothetical protein